MAQSEGKIGSLFYGMTLDTKDFSKKLKDVRKNLKTIGQSMREDFSKIAKGGLIIGSALAAGTTGLLLFSKSSLEATNAQLLLADSIGATQAEIAGLELSTQKWGVETNMVIDKMREFGGLNEFKRMAEDVKNAGSETDQLAKSIELFGNEGAKMLPLLQQGAQGFADMEREARSLGLALSPDQIRKSRVAWEEYESTLMSIKGLGKQIGAALLEPLGTVAAGVKGFIATFKDGILGSFESIGQTITSFIQGAFNLFVDYGIPFINCFISFAGQIGEAFDVLFSWLSPATSAIGNTFGSLFKGITDFLATFKQNIVLYIAAPIEAVLKGTFNGLAQLSNFLNGIVENVLIGLNNAKLISDEFLQAYSESVEDQAGALRGLGKDLAEPFKIAQETALDEMADILAEQGIKNKNQQEKFKGFLANFDMRFNSRIERLPVVAVEAAKNMAKSVSDKMSGLVLSGSQEEQNIINQSQDRLYKLTERGVKAQEGVLKELKETQAF